MKIVDQPKWIDRQTPNLSKRTHPIRYIVIHHGGGTADGDLRTLTTRRPVGSVSADFYIDRAGRIYKLNPQLSQYYTWHAGRSRWDGKIDINRYSIGIEAEHDPRIHSMWTIMQYNELSRLVAWLMQRYGLSIDAAVGHRDIAWPRGRKIDPSNFDWELFRLKIGRALN